MESKDLKTASASAPSYDEAMKCSTVPPNQMQPYPSHMLEQPGHMQHPPMAQPQNTILMMPPAAPPVVTSQPMVQTFNIAGGGMGATCRSCSKPLHTRTNYVSTCSTHCAFCLCCLFICWPCAPFVYCTDTCREPRIQCASCGARI